MKFTWAVLSSLIASAAACGEPVAIENGAVRLALNPAAHGAIAALTDLRTGVDFVVSNAPALYELRFADGGRGLTEADAEATSVRREGEALVVSSPRHAGLPIAVECRFRREPGSPLVYGRIAVSNGLDRALADVVFPVLHQPRVLGADEAHDTLLLPYCDGILVHAPLQADWLPNCTYPGNASLQALARFNDRAGLFLAAFDATGQAKRFAVEKRDAALRVTLTHELAQLRQGAWQAAYDVVLGTYQGDWQVAADLYKAWAVRQRWCHRTFAQRVAEGDVPRWVAEPSLFYAWSLRGESEPGKFGNRVSQIVSQADAWRTLLDAPTTMMLMSWEKHGPWITPDYFPPFGGEGPFTAATAGLHAQGHRAFVFLSGLNWTLRKDRACDNGHFDDTAAFEARGAVGAVCGTDGKPQHFKGHPDMGEYAQLCPVTPTARETLLSAALACAKLGIDGVQADQILGGGMPSCYNPAHGHPLGGGTWSAEAVYSLFGDVRREGRKVNPNFAWSVEEPGEFFIPVLDTYHARDYTQGRWPRNGSTVEGVPLFTHVYHAYLPGYGGDSCPATTQPNDAALYQQGMNLVCGKAPGVAVWGSFCAPANTDAAQARLLREHLRLWKTAAPFLVFGDRLAAPPLEVPAVTNRFWNSSDQPPRALATPAVLHSVWRSPENKKATVFVCVAREPMTFHTQGQTLTLQPGEARLIPDF